MTTSLKDLVAAYCEAWNVDEAERRTILEGVWDERGLYCDPLGRVDGLEEFIQHIGEARAQFPGHRIEVTSGVDEHHSQFRFTWELNGPDGTTVLAGTDFGQLSPDGRIKSITGFFGPVPPLESA